MQNYIGRILAVGALALSAFGCECIEFFPDVPEGTPSATEGAYDPRTVMNTLHPSLTRDPLPAPFWPGEMDPDTDTMRKLQIENPSLYQDLRKYQKDHGINPPNITVQIRSGAKQ
ncbi:MAG: hypothetical protein ABIG30_03660 [Candidatus Aenigmatarchaeota archaeon]